MDVLAELQEIARISAEASLHLREPSQASLGSTHVVGQCFYRLSVAYRGHDVVHSRITASLPGCPLHTSDVAPGVRHFSHIISPVSWSE